GGERRGGGRRRRARMGAAGTGRTGGLRFVERGERGIDCLVGPVEERVPVVTGQPRLCLRAEQEPPSAEPFAIRCDAHEHAPARIFATVRTTPAARRVSSWSVSGWRGTPEIGRASCREMGQI